MGMINEDYVCISEHKGHRCKTCLYSVQTGKYSLPYDQVYLYYLFNEIPHEGPMQWNEGLRTDYVTDQI